MLLLSKSSKSSQHLEVSQKVCWLVGATLKSGCHSHFSSGSQTEIQRITRVINDHPFPDLPLYPTLHNQIPRAVLSTSFVENVLGSLFAAHCNGLKAFEFFMFCLQCSQYRPSSDAFERTLHILTRMRYFDKAWGLMEEIKRVYPSLLTLKSLSIMLSRIAKFQSFEDTLEAFERMEKDIFVGKLFGVDEFNVLLRAFCTQREMKEARSVFNKLHSRFSPNTKTMNILLLGFKESGDVTAMELFYHEMLRRGFKPNSITYNVRIDAYCKKGRFGDGLRLLEEMESLSCFPTLETLTTLIHGAGVAKNTSKAKQLFNEIHMRNLHPDTGAYNALISSLIRARNVSSAVSLMDEMDLRSIGHDNVTYHTMFSGLIKLKGTDGVSELYRKMIERNFMPKTRTMVMLIKFFCENRRLDLALDLWRYLMERGYCPHTHALDLLVTGLYAHGRVVEAFECSRQMLERGRHMSGAVFLMLERHLLTVGEMDKLQKLNQMIQRLQTVLPPSGHSAFLPVEEDV